MSNQKRAGIKKLDPRNKEVKIFKELARIKNNLAIKRFKGKRKRSKYSIF